MRARAALLAGLLTAFLLPPPQADASDRQAWFDTAVRYDLGGEKTTAVAFEWYRRAAEAGLPEAEFNVAVMLDSGRGVKRDMALAATWYARAAAQNNHRAAYNLGQLYETGDGVPQNIDLARAWYAVSDLEAARSHLDALRNRTITAAALTAPTLVAPSGGEANGPDAKTVELVWTSRAQPEPVDFLVELRLIEPTSSREVFSTYTKTSSLVAPVPDPKGKYAWRVIALARQAGQYASSNWAQFTRDANGVASN